MKRKSDLEIEAENLLEDIKFSFFKLIFVKKLKKKKKAVFSPAHLYDRYSLISEPFVFFVVKIKRKNGLISFPFIIFEKRMIFMGFENSKNFFSAKDHESDHIDGVIMQKAVQQCFVFLKKKVEYKQLCVSFGDYCEKKHPYFLLLKEEKNANYFIINIFQNINKKFFPCGIGWVTFD